MFNNKKVWFVQNYTLPLGLATQQLVTASADHSRGFRLSANGDTLYLLSDSPSKKNPGLKPEYAIIRVDAKNVIPSGMIEGTQVGVLSLDQILQGHNELGKAIALASAAYVQPKPVQFQLTNRAGQQRMPA